MDIVEEVKKMFEEMNIKEMCKNAIEKAQTEYNEKNAAKNAEIERLTNSGNIIDEIRAYCLLGGNIEDLKRI